ncbi:oligosaccharide flippase family protein, partial [Candidatus Bathyarchaeota archaeon]|nr:oligosaccharide flippase family protein [Candidatus Bathyarchaeota archaeon]
LGLERGIARQVAFYRGKHDVTKAKEVLFSSLQIVIVASVLLSLILFFISDFISVRFFHIPELSAIIKIFCIAIPFLVLNRIFTSMFRGFDRAQPHVYMENILRNALFPLLLIIVVLLHLSFMWVVYAFVSSIILTFISYAVYATKNLPLALSGRSSVFASSVTKELLLFSLPLLLLGMFASIIAWTDTLMLGYFMFSDDVGLYNAAVPLAHLLPIFLAAMNFLYVPVVSRLYAKNQKEETKRSYVIVTKWVMSATLPIFLIFVLFPEFSLDTLFGFRYIGAAFALQILSIGFFISTILGPNGSTLMVIGETRFLMWSTLIAAIANIILNIALIPPLGINGAAIATASAIAIFNFSVSAKLYSLTKIHPFSMNYLKSALALIVLALILYAVVKNLVSAIPFWLPPILLILFLGASALATLLTRSFDKEDIMMLLAIERRLGLNLSAIKRILRRFV